MRLLQSKPSATFMLGAALAGCSSAATGTGAIDILAHETTGDAAVAHPVDAGTDACAKPERLTYENFGQGFMSQYCLSCHSETLTDPAARSGAPDDHNFDSVAAIRGQADHIAGAAAVPIDDGSTDPEYSMPPGQKQPTEAERRKLAEWLGCGAPTSAAKTASARIEPRSGNTTLAGELQVAKYGATSRLTIKLTGTPPGQHGAHLHMTGDCSAPDATSAGGHWNPDGVDHGAPTGASHLGDLGIITVAPDGTAQLTLDNPRWTIGDAAATDVVGKAIVIHSAADDFVTQPTGNSGGRIGCGVIRLDGSAP